MISKWFSRVGKLKKIKLKTLEFKWNTKTKAHLINVLLAEKPYKWKLVEKIKNIFFIFCFSSSLLLTSQCLQSAFHLFEFTLNFFLILFDFLEKTKFIWKSQTIFKKVKLSEKIWGKTFYINWLTNLLLSLNIKDFLQNKSTIRIAKCDTCSGSGNMMDASGAWGALAIFDLTSNVNSDKTFSTSFWTSSSSSSWKQKQWEDWLQH